MKAAAIHAEVGTLIEKALGLAFVMALLIGVPASAADAPPIFVGGAFIRQHAIEDEHGHLLVPVRGVFEAFGASVAYEPPRIVVVRKNGTIVAGLVIGRRFAVVGNAKRNLGAAPIRRGGRVFVPLRSVAEIAGASVVYSSKPRLVDIRLPNNVLAVSPPARPPAGIYDDPGLPIWVYALVGVFVLAFAFEAVRRVAYTGRFRSSRRPIRSAGLPAVRALQLSYPVDGRDQHGIGKIRK